MKSSIKDLPIEHDHVSNQTVAGQSEQALEDTANEVTQMVLFSLEAWQEALYTKLVDKVGTRTYWEDWADDVADIAQAQITRITSLLDGADPTVAEEFERFLEGLRGNLNDSITRDEAVSMLSQHLITAPVFDALFAEHDFASHNPVSKVMQRMVDVLDDSQLDAETEKLEKFYDSVRMRAADVTSASGKQTVIKELYERFFKKAFRKQSEALGIVYTPVEIVDFILRAADDVSRTHFGRGLTDENVHILDPFTGTGTFMVRLLQSGLITPEDLARKYASELHATEIMLLAYYVAAVNIETTYHALLGEKALRDGTDAPSYEPFDGIVLADTFQITEDDDKLDSEVFKQNNQRIKRQLDAKINVIIGNPPYSVGQSSANDLNANVKYPTLDGRIEQSYAAKSTAMNKNSLYDSYLRAFRWATDRIGNHGVVAFVSNGGWIDGNTADGVRLSLAEDYSNIYVFNLRGNARTAGNLRQKEAGNVFDAGGRTTIAVFIGVKRAGTDTCTIHYHDIGDYLTTQDKLEIVDNSTIDNIEWTPITPNSHGDWTNQRSDDFEAWPVLGDKRQASAPTYFSVFSRGLETARDAWVYNYSNPQLERYVKTLIATYEEARSVLIQTTVGSFNELMSRQPELNDSMRIKWSSSLQQSLLRGREAAHCSRAYRTSLYRPFNKQKVYFEPLLNHRQGELNRMFPTPKHSNIGIGVSAPSTRTPFSVLGLDLVPNLGLYMDPVQLFTRWTWEPINVAEGELDFGGDVGASTTTPGAPGEVLDGFQRMDNITDEIHTIYREALGSDVSKEDIFHFVYGQLHDPGYRETYAADLKKMLPHIETPTDQDRFDQLVAAGKALMELHINYEDVDPWPVDIQIKPTADGQVRRSGVSAFR